MNQSIMDIYRQANDGNIGQTLLRLAGLAESVHFFEVAEEIKQETKREGNVQVKGLVCEAGADDGVAPSVEVRTEVNR